MCSSDLTPYTGCERWFASYWAFWPVCAVIAGLMAWGVEFALAKLYPLETDEFVVPVDAILVPSEGD